MKIAPVMLAGLPFELQAEISENVFRKDWTPSEIDAIRRRCEVLLRAQAKKNQAAAGPSSGRGVKLTGSGKFPEAVKGQTRDKIGAFAGLSGRTIQKIAAVMDAAKADPQKFGHLPAEMDRTGKVNAAHRELRRTVDEARILGLAPVAARFKTLIIDPPWRYDADFLGRGKPDYGTMSHEQLLALSVPSWAEENCHLYLWTTNAMFPAAIELMAKWGFRHNTVLTWAKPHYGLGTHFRGQTEHVIFGIRGTLATRCNSISTLFEAPVGKRSEKPEKFYEIVRAASYPPYGEAFQRERRPGLVNLFEHQIASEAAQ
jgi:N6-adenosine-specific RNA methylase IME4